MRTYVGNIFMNIFNLYMCACIPVYVHIYVYVCPHARV